MISPFLAQDDFLAVIKNAPLIAIDLIVRNDINQVLMGYRRNSPARNTWFVPGGRIRKNENLGQAFSRITQAELGLAVNLQHAVFYGIFEHFYPGENTFDVPGIDTHYINLAYEIKDLPVSNLNLTAQHDDHRWMDVEEILAHPDVHPNSKLYFSM